MEMNSLTENRGSDIRPHVGMVAIVGQANVGKSSLLNAMLSEKVSIVSPVCQTTRNLIRAIHTEEQGQIVFLDTPGLHKAQGELGRIMNKTARGAPEGTDLILLVLDVSRRPREEDMGWMTHAARAVQPVMLALNKVDQTEDYTEAYRACWAEMGSDSPFPDALRVSAVSGEGIETLRATLLSRLPAGPLLFPEEALSDYPRKLAVGDMIREKYFLRLHDELPHSIAVEVHDIVDINGGMHVTADIYVERDSQKGILIGEKGRMLRYVKRATIKELNALWECPVTLDIRVRVEKHWQRNHFILKRLGYRM